MKVYTKHEVEENLKSTMGWVLINGAIEKKFRFENFTEALAFINHIGNIAEEANHHPEIHNIYNQVTLRLNTHSANGITKKDFDLAKKIDSIR